MRIIKITILLLVTIFCFSRCHQPKETKQPLVKNKSTPKKRIAPASIGYHFEKSKTWLKKNAAQQQQNIVQAVNRTDSSHLAKMDSILIPNDLSGDLEYYLPFPFSVPYLKDIKKVIFFSYAAQSFGAYEWGELTYTGQTNMGRKTDPTPTGLYYTNWKAEKTTSTFNDEWDLRWNFNIENKLGIGFHQYELPGYPASHSCLRLTEKDAKYLYDWADQWILEGKDSVKVMGTPVIVFGSYDFNGPKPWLQLVNNPHVLDIPAAVIQQQAMPFLQEIINEQAKRDAVAEEK